MLLKRINIKQLLLFTLTICFLNCNDSKENGELTVISGSTMGTGYTIKINESPSKPILETEKLKLGIETILININQQMSIYDINSDISHFNNRKTTDWITLPSETVELIEQALKISEMTDGAFDVTVGPLVNRWGFGPKTSEFKIPDKKEIDSILKITGYQKISTTLKPPAVKKELPDIYCDLSAIAKGYTVDVITRYLDSLGFNDYLVEIGGEIKTHGNKNRNLPWQIGIETPENDTSGVQKVVTLDNISMATSGDYYNYFEINGIRYSHTIDPRTGMPVKHHLASVTVIHQSCAVADALATAINVLGPDEGYQLACREDLAVFLIIRDNGGYTEKITPEFTKFFSNSNND